MNVASRIIRTAGVIIMMTMASACTNNNAVVATSVAATMDAGATQSAITTAAISATQAAAVTPTPTATATATPTSTPTPTIISRPTATDVPCGYLGRAAVQELIDRRILNRVQEQTINATSKPPDQLQPVIDEFTTIINQINGIEHPACMDNMFGSLVTSITITRDAFQELYNGAAPNDVKLQINIATAAMEQFTREIQQLTRDIR